MLARLRARNPNRSVIKSMIYGVCRRIAKSVLFTLFGARALHRERVPADGPLLIAANHQSFLDPPLVGSFITQRQVAFVARSGLFRNRFFGWFISAVNSIPIREDGRGDTGAIKAALSILAGGHALVIFPEGARTPDGALHPFKRGTALLLKRAQCPVLPVAVEGPFDAWPIHAKRPRPFASPVMVMYGHPISYDDLMKDGPDAGMDRLARTIEDMRLQLRALIRQRTADRYPAKGPGDRHFFSDSLPAPIPDSATVPRPVDTLSA
jgi:1-acyl-sn-glycerol-3-phosphate acyltransferase